jgi:hypothetical protein
MDGDGARESFEEQHEWHAAVHERHRDQLLGRGVDGWVAERAHRPGVEEHRQALTIAVPAASARPQPHVRATIMPILPPVHRAAAPQRRRPLQRRAPPRRSPGVPGRGCRPGPRGGTAGWRIAPRWNSSSSISPPANLACRISMAERSADRSPDPGRSRGPRSRTTTTAATTTSATSVTRIIAAPSQAPPDIHPHMGIDDTSPVIPRRCRASTWCSARRPQTPAAPARHLRRLLGEQDPTQVGVQVRRRYAASNGGRFPCMGRSSHRRGVQRPGRRCWRAGTIRVWHPPTESRTSQEWRGLRWPLRHKPHRRTTELSTPPAGPPTVPPRAPLSPARDTAAADAARSQGGEGPPASRDLHR